MAKKQPTLSISDRQRDELRTLLSGPRETARTLLEVGRLVQDLHPHADQDKKRRYGDEALQTLAEEVGAGDDDELYRARTFALVYHDQPLDRINNLSWSHLYLLATVPNKKHRRELERNCVTNNWSIKQLDSAKEQLCGKRSKGGRKPKPAKELGQYGTVKRILKYSHDWLKHGQQYLDELPDLLNEADGVKKHLDKLRRLRPSVVEALTAFVKAAEALQGQLRSTAQRKRKFKTKPRPKAKTESRATTSAEPQPKQRRPKSHGLGSSEPLTRGR